MSVYPAPGQTVYEPYEGDNASLLERWQKYQFEPHQTGYTIQDQLMPIGDDARNPWGAERIPDWQWQAWGMDPESADPNKNYVYYMEHGISPPGYDPAKAVSPDELANRALGWDSPVNALGIGGEAGVHGSTDVRKRQALARLGPLMARQDMFTPGVTEELAGTPMSQTSSVQQQLDRGLPVESILPAAVSRQIARNNAYTNEVMTQNNPDGSTSLIRGTQIPPGNGTVPPGTTPPGGLLGNLIGDGAIGQVGGILGQPSTPSGMSYSQQAYNLGGPYQAPAVRPILPLNMDAETAQGQGQSGNPPGKMWVDDMGDGVGGWVNTQPKRGSFYNYIPPPQPPADKIPGISGPLGRPLTPEESQARNDAFRNNYGPEVTYLLG